MMLLHLMTSYDTSLTSSWNYHHQHCDYHQGTFPHKFTFVHGYETLGTPYHRTNPKLA